jgi:hypothetical protein
MTSLLKIQIPNPKTQINSKLQIPKGRRGIEMQLGVWNLEFVWDLGFGIWDFSPR